MMGALTIPFGETVIIDYTNYRGERGLRRITPISVAEGSNEWHPETQELLAAWDHEKAAERFFAVKDIHSWQWPA
jgi:predicted DNA-binding transcriptional regulator YafY